MHPDAPAVIRSNDQLFRSAPCTNRPEHGILYWTFVLGLPHLHPATYRES